MVKRQMGHMIVNQQIEAASKELCKNQEALIEKICTLPLIKPCVRKEISYLDARTAIVKRKGVSRPYGNRRRGYTYDFHTAWTSFPSDFGSM
jgi:hypothetical protein